MKILAHVPVENYGFTSIEVDSEELKGKLDPESSVKDFTKDLYDGISEKFKPKIGLDAKEWRNALDALNMGKSASIEQFEGMNEQQRWCYHQQELSIGRISPKEDSTKEFNSFTE